MEGILEQLGYYLCTPCNWSDESMGIYGVWIAKNHKHIAYGEGKSHRSAVIQALIKLGGELNAKR